jgi:uncharacterized protein YxjI
MMSDLANPWSHATYVLRRQVLRLFGGAFEIYDPYGSPAFFSEQRAFKLREDIRLYTDRSKGVELLAIKARQVVDFSAAYDVFDPVDNLKVGALRRKGVKSMLKDEWEILDESDQPIGRVSEDSWLMATLRRFINIIPQSFHAEIDGQRVAVYKQNFNPFVQKIRLDFTSDVENRLDRRLGITAAILLCAIEGRQQ